MKNTLEKLYEVKAFLNTLLDSSNEEAIDLLVNYGEDIEETLQKAAFLNTLLNSSYEEAIDLLVNYGEDIEETLQKAINQIIISNT
jgi:hypothetical protein